MKIFFQYAPDEVTPQSNCIIKQQFFLITFKENSHFLNYLTFTRAIPNFRKTVNEVKKNS